VNYYPFHIGDFRSGTVHMTRLSRWIYRDMMDVYYDTEKPLPLDFEALCDQIGVEAEDERAVVQKLLRFKFTQEVDGYHHDICKAVIVEYQQKAETARENGKAGGRPRKQPGTNQKPTGNLVGSDPVSIGKPIGRGLKTNQEPITNNQIEDQNHSAGAQKYSARDDLLASGVAAQTVTDWLKLRAAKKAPATKTALDAVRREATLAGLSLDSALQICCTRGWQGFKAEWVTQNGTGSPPKSKGNHGNFGSQDYRAGVSDDGKF
jgi:uncharacterized protein YdaU (DUF1376 family)